MPLAKKLIEQIRNNEYRDEFLSLSGQGLGHPEIEELVDALKNNSHIKQIDLSANQISSLSVGLLYNLNIKSLNLSENPIGESAKIFGESQHIEELSLAECGLSNAAANKVLMNPKLKKLNLANNDLDDTALEGA